ncbi:hypothetical protein H8356DRAFT_1435799 [Neocallimastix lanati (nom. inval.)]|nr:hypothetical protein H8356DRAFT_1435799 [Neocallimastix sp. JGI-2020a]
MPLTCSQDQNKMVLKDTIIIMWKTKGKESPELFITPFGVIVYLDDILVIREKQERKLFCKIQKCEFFVEIGSASPRLIYHKTRVYWTISNIHKKRAALLSLKQHYISENKIINRFNSKPDYKLYNCIKKALKNLWATLRNTTFQIQQIHSTIILYMFVCCSCGYFHTLKQVKTVFEIFESIAFRHNLEISETNKEKKPNHLIKCTEYKTVKKCKSYIILNDNNKDAPVSIVRHKMKNEIRKKPQSHLI